jgi:hypothetical protein
VTTTDTGPSAPAPVVARRGTWAAATVLLLVLTVALPAAMAGVRPGDLADFPVLLAMVITWWAALRLVQLYVEGEARIVELGFFTFVYLWMGLAPLAQVGADRFPLAQTFSSSTQVSALMTTLVGLAGYEVGRLLARAKSGGLRLPERVEHAQVSPVRTWVLAALGLAATAVITLTSGGLAVRFSSRFEAERSLFGEIDPGLRVDQAPDKAMALIKGAFLGLPVFFALLLLLYLRRTARARGVSDRLVTGPAATVLLLALIAANVVANNPIANSRLQVGVVAFAFLAVLVPPDTARRFRMAVVGVLIIFLLVFPYADIFRYSTVLVDDEGLSEQLVVSPDYGMFNQDMNTIVYVDEEGFTNGRQVAGTVGALVPRKLWAGKPIATGDLVSRTENINASSTLWSEAYIDFGRVGVFVAFVLWGAGSRVLSTAYVRRRRDRPELAGAIVPVFAGIQLFIIRGALQPTMSQIWPLLLMTVFCFTLAPRAGPPAGEEPVPQADGAHGDGG